MYKRDLAARKERLQRFEQATRHEGMQSFETQSVQRCELTRSGTQAAHLPQGEVGYRNLPRPLTAAVLELFDSVLLDRLCALLPRLLQYFLKLTEASCALPLETSFGNAKDAWTDHSEDVRLPRSIDRSGLDHCGYSVGASVEETQCSDLIQRIAEPNYMPTDQHVLRSRLKTTKIIAILYQIYDQTLGNRMTGGLSSSHEGKLNEDAPSEIR